MVDYIVKDTYRQKRFSKDTLLLLLNFTLCLLYFYNKKGIKVYLFQIHLEFGISIKYCRTAVTTQNNRGKNTKLPRKKIPSSFINNLKLHLSQIFIDLIKCETLLCTRYCSRYQGYGREQKTKILAPTHLTFQQ